MMQRVVVGFALALLMQGCSKDADAAKSKEEKAAGKLIPGMKVCSDFEVANKGGKCLPVGAKSATGAPTATYTIIKDIAQSSGAIKGTISYTGSKKDGQLQVVKDLEGCGGNKEIAAGKLLVKNGKLQNAVVFLDEIKAGKTMKAQKHIIDNVKCGFTPRITVARVGDELAATNSDPVFHNTALGEIANKGLAQGKVTVLTNKLKAKYTGKISVSCAAHSWMQGYVYAASHPYITLTDANGNFELTAVPVGKDGGPATYTLKVWHEELGTKSLKVTVNKGQAAIADLDLK
jgi:plastocyanin